VEPGGYYSEQGLLEYGEAPSSSSSGAGGNSTAAYASRSWAAHVREMPTQEAGGGGAASILRSLMEPLDDHKQISDYNPQQQQQHRQQQQQQQQQQRQRRPPRRAHSQPQAHPRPQQQLHASSPPPHPPASSASWSPPPGPLPRARSADGFAAVRNSPSSVRRSSLGAGQPVPTGFLPLQRLDSAGSSSALLLQQQMASLHLQQQQQQQQLGLQPQVMLALPAISHPQQLLQSPLYLHHQQAAPAALVPPLSSSHSTPLDPEWASGAAVQMRACLLAPQMAPALSAAPAAPIQQLQSPFGLPARLVLPQAATSPTAALAPVPMPQLQLLLAQPDPAAQQLARLELQLPPTSEGGVYTPHSGGW